ncbi:DNA-binding transcriptional regulator, LysR family [Ferrimonas sediminum]|uniref:DNA-binding transcriptional regulator, LysR family n=2 Tax=Ferrimonas sediminum TaxID=718193 RepID=A0A1G9BX53_9GAMM|nr:DNA-binding transcriptional regulator, LysR family [Ferrimonas sediminum]
MELEELYRRDLSLLVALQVLIEERSVTQAAKRLHLSQSATSRILSRLRTMLGDPLFTRVGSSLLPTNFALNCQQRLQAPIAELSQLLTPRQFDPAQCRQTFCIAVTDFGSQSLMPTILERLYSQAPGLNLEVTPVQHQELKDQLGSKGVDLAICRSPGESAPLKSKELGQVGVRAVMAPDHPLANQPLTLSNYQQYPQAVVAISDGVKALLDDAMTSLPERRTLLRSSSLCHALVLLKHQPLLLTLPSGMAEQAAANHNLVVKPLPFSLPRIDYHLFWHSRTDLDPAQQWLRDEITSATAAILNGKLA